MTRTELDSHADTSCFGKGNCYVIGRTGCHVSVNPFVSTLGCIEEVPIVTAAIVVDNPRTSATTILIFHQVLLLNDLSHNLLCPNQLRLHGHTVNECPKIFTSALDDMTHSIILADGSTTPLWLHGVVDLEMQDMNIPRIECTAELPEWEPNSTILEKDESLLANQQGGNPAHLDYACTIAVISHL